MRFDIDSLRSMRPHCGGIDAVEWSSTRARRIVFAGRDGMGGTAVEDGETGQF